jgi:hypothetical protein
MSEKDNGDATSGVVPPVLRPPPVAATGGAQFPVAISVMSARSNFQQVLESVPYWDLGLAVDVVQALRAVILHTPRRVRRNERGERRWGRRRSA